jgi:hypothetical protein
VSTVAVIWYSSYFISGGTRERGLTRFDYRAGNSTYKYMPLLDTNIKVTTQGGPSFSTLTGNALFNVSTDVTDLFVIWPTHYFVVCRTRMRYEVVDYTTMGSIMFFDRVDATSLERSQTGGFGAYIDYLAGRSRVCISHDYTDMITCWDLAPGALG